MMLLLTFVVCKQRIINLHSPPGTAQSGGGALAQRLQISVEARPRG